MNQTDLIALIKERINMTIDRDHAKIGRTVPFLIINVLQPDNVAADNRVYLEKDEITLTLYCFEIDPALEQPIKDLLSEIGVGWTRTETYLDDEKVWEVEFGFDLM